MSEFSDLIERVKFDNLIGYLLYGTNTENQHDGTYEDRIRESFDNIFATLEKLFPSVSRKNDDLYGAILDFSIIHSEVYLEMGLIAGLQLYKNLEKQCSSVELVGLQSIINKNTPIDRENI